MRSSLPKVLHSVGGRSLIGHILTALAHVAPGTRVGIVVGHGREHVEKAVRGLAAHAQLTIDFIVQESQRGTGDAARVAMESGWGEQTLAAKSPVLVLPGDLPLITRELVAQMLEPLSRTTKMRLLTTELPDPTGYGRVVRRGGGKKGAVLRIVEQKDAAVRELAIREVAVSIYTFQSAFLRMGLGRLDTKNAQGELYLTDLVSQASKSAGGIEVLPWTEHEDLRGVNDPWELAEAGRLFRDRQTRHWAREGVRFLDPSSVWIDADSILGADSVISPQVEIYGNSVLDPGVTVGSRVQLRNTKVGAGAQLKVGTLAEDSTIAAGAAVGPYAHLRPGSVVGPEAKIGNFVELKNSRIGKKTAISHLSYVGDAEVGERVNIGCGFVTCNYDGRVIDGSRKHKTIIEDDVFLGSDCQAVAPVKIGKGAFVASGSTITEDVEPEALAIARTRQTTKSGYARKYRKNEGSGQEG